MIFILINLFSLDFLQHEEENAILEKLTDCINEMGDLAEREAFVRGFTLGARIIIEVLSTDCE